MRPHRSLLIVIIVLTITGVQFGCGTMPNGRRWGKDATYSPGWERIGQAARNAALAPETWLPAAGAVACIAARADHNVSNYAAEHSPVFGSRDNANQASNYLLNATEIAWIASGLATPSGTGTEEWGTAKMKGLGVEGGAGAVTLGTVDILKLTTHRTRPDSSNTESFPSGHSTGAAYFSTLASRHIEALSWSSGATTASQIGLGAITAATAWARIEADQHYPSDVLAGVALGHFFGAFAAEAFLGLDNPHHAMFIVEPLRHGTTAMIQFSY